MTLRRNDTARPNSPQRSRSTTSPALLAGVGITALFASLSWLAGPASAQEINLVWDTVKVVNDPIDGDTFLPNADGPFKTNLKANGLTKLTFSKRAKTKEDWFYTSLPVDAFKPAGIDFGSVAAKNGAVHENTTKKKITDLHLTLLKAGLFFVKDSASNSGGNAFTDKLAYSNALVGDKTGTKFTTVDLTGGNIAADDLIWSKISLLGGKDANGRLTDAVAPPPEKKKEGGTSTGSTGSGTTPTPKMDFTPGPTPGSGTLVFTPGKIDFAHYANGTTSNPAETILGSDISVDPMTLVSGPGSDPAAPDAYQLSDSSFTIQMGTDVFLHGTLTEALLYQDSSVPGFDSVLQADLEWDYYGGELNSPVLDEMFDPLGPGYGRTMFFRTNLFGETNGLTSATNSLQGFGKLSFSTVVPEPGTLATLLLGAGMLSVFTLRRRHVTR